MAGIDYQATPQNLLYAKVSTGYKSGGFTDASQYGPETVTSYEVGSKNQFADGKLQLNLAAYSMDYRDQQVNQYMSVSGVVQAVITSYFSAKAAAASRKVFSLLRAPEACRPRRSKYQSSAKALACARLSVYPQIRSLAP